MCNKWLEKDSKLPMLGMVLSSQEIVGACVGVPKADEPDRVE